MNTSLPQSSTSPPVSNPEFSQVPASINNAITKCGFQIAQALHNLGTAITDAGIEKAQGAQLVEEKLGLTKVQRYFFWRLHKTYVVTPNKIGTSLHPAYLQSLDIRVLDSFRPSFLEWCRSENRTYSNIVVKQDRIECKYHGQGTCCLSHMTVQQARDFKYSPESPEPYRDPCRDPYPEDSVFHIPETPDDGCDAFENLLMGVTATAPPVVPLVTYPHGDVSLLFTDEELGL